MSFLLLTLIVLVCFCLAAKISIAVIEADKGTENSRVAKHNGLLYHALDEKGNRVGVPIKASSFYDKPTLKNLEKKFVVNDIKRQPDKTRIKTAIDTAFLKNKIIILPQLVRQLQKEGIDTVLRQNAEGLVYGVTFVDHKIKSVFNGSSIGKEYSVKGLQDSCVLNQQKVGQKIDYSRKELKNVLYEHSASMGIKELTNFLDVLMKVDNNWDYLSKNLLHSKKKRRRKL